MISRIEAVTQREAVATRPAQTLQTLHQNRQTLQDHTASDLRFAGFAGFAGFFSNSACTHTRLSAHTRTYTRSRAGKQKNPAKPANPAPARTR